VGLSLAAQPCLQMPLFYMPRGAGSRRSHLSRVTGLQALVLVWCVSVLCCAVLC
jgi:hypothetical protein